MTRFRGNVDVWASPPGAFREAPINDSGTVLVQLSGGQIEVTALDEEDD